MIGLDTNVLVRYLTQDDPVQAALANDFIGQQLSTQHPGVISHIVLCEVVWVLSRAYPYSREQVVDTLYAILTCQEFKVEAADVAMLAWQDFVQGNADFSDYLLGRVNQHLGASHTVTFDRKAASAPMFKLLG
jgi:predicted nucleic-acid-binding protein